MSTYIEVKADQVQHALAQLLERTGDVEPFFRRIGEAWLDRIHTRFETSTGPDGTPWATNSPVTIARYIASMGGKSKGGKAALPGKKPLIGASRRLISSFHFDADAESLTIASVVPYVFMQHFGGTKLQFPHLWGDIPARPMLPIQGDGTLYPQEETEIIEMLQQYLVPDQ
ncbi:phage virion morphogenesis protein [Pseudoduganella sp. RAF53_2]|uniref:phage virion morphogenesis protein n=1 Tax=unclassified Pseudoduganella TaxID=2637179 RepID=UPI003F9BDBD7